MSVGIRINETTEETARHWSDSILRTGLEKTPNYTNLEASGRFFTGYIGELCFQGLLCLRGKKYFYQAHPDGRPDKSGSDIFVWLEKKTSVNVKTASKSFHRKMMIPEKQFQKYGCDLYVAGHIVGNVCWFEGWLPHAELENRKPEQVLIATVSIPFSELFPMEELLTKLK